ncbi:MAG: hypothetical protein Q9168_002372 [Polycauliona sp. 1 TL-2023]
MSSSPSATSSPIQSASASASATANAPSSSDSHTSIGAVVGGIVGGIAVIALLAVLAMFLLRRRRRQRSSPAVIAPKNSDKESPGSSYPSSSFPTPFHELETPPPNPWHKPQGNIHEMPSPEIGGWQRKMDMVDEKQVVDSNNGGLGIYTPYKPTQARGHSLYDAGRNISYELDGRGIERDSKGRI